MLTSRDKRENGFRLRRRVFHTLVDKGVALRSTDSKANEWRCVDRDEEKTHVEHQLIGLFLQSEVFVHFFSINDRIAMNEQFD